jgi:hypothetical protein
VIPVVLSNIKKIILVGEEILKLCLEHMLLTYISGVRESELWQIKIDMQTLFQISCQQAG